MYYLYFNLCMGISLSAIYRVILFDREQMGKKTIVTWFSMSNKLCYDWRGYVKEDLISIYCNLQLPIVI